MKTEKENPKGWYLKYHIRKVVDYKFIRHGFLGEPVFEYIYKDVDDDAEYFVMRIDDGCKDKIHLQACKESVLKYAEKIKDHLPELSSDLIEKLTPKNNNELLKQ